MLDNLSFCRFKAFFRVKKTVKLPPFTGATFKGALGHAMMKVRYGQRDDICSACSCGSQCHYENLYEYIFNAPFDHQYLKNEHQSLNSRMRRKTYPQPFILEPPVGGCYLPGEILPLSFVLVGKAIEYFPFIICAFSLLKKGWLGSGRGEVELEAVVDDCPLEHKQNSLIYDSASESIVGPGQVLDFEQIREMLLEASSRIPFPGTLRIRLSTPFRFRVAETFATPSRFRHEKKLEEVFTFELFMKNVLRRLTFLSLHSPPILDLDFHTLLDQAKSVKTSASTLRWYPWKKYSSRQNRKVNLDGVIGDVLFSGDLRESLPYLKMCEFLNVGKNCAFGLGKYQVTAPGYL